MRTIERLTCLMVVAACLSGCGKAGQKDVMIRIANRSEVEFVEVGVKFPSQEENFGDISPGKASEYRKVGKAYRYAYIEAKIDGREAVLQPTDYVGETLLSGGNYTYALRYDPKATGKHGRIRLELEQD